VVDGLVGPRLPLYDLAAHQSLITVPFSITVEASPSAGSTSSLYARGDIRSLAAHRVPGRGPRSPLFLLSQMARGEIDVSHCIERPTVDVNRWLPSDGENTH
jgi:hypothetical protein